MTGPKQHRQPGLSFFAAAVWSIGATALFQLVLLLGLSLKPNAELDIVAGVACQAAAYLLALFLYLRVHEPESRLADVVGARPASFSLCALSAALGAALQIPASALGAFVERFWSYTPSELLARAQHLEALTPARQIAVVAGVCLIGPLVEELFFRGALFRGLRQRHTAGMTTIGVAAFFAAAHQDGRVFLPILLVGLAMTHLRAISGSLLPPLVMHIAFNATSIVPTLGKPIEIDELATSIPPLVTMAGIGASAALLLATRAVARSSPRALAARAIDGGG